jgi:very-short-patch-repair endonuclease
MDNRFFENTEYQVDKARALRKQGTPAEKILWEALRNRQVNNIKFRRQHPVLNYIADFCSEKIKLIIEIDGSIHDLEDNIEYDKQRQQHLESAGYTVIRFKNEEVINNLPSVINSIKEIK